MRQQLTEIVDAIQKACPLSPRAGLILGSGLGNLAEQIGQEAVFDFKDLPHFPISTATGHAGRLIFGELVGVPIIAMQGRFHLYEGYSPEEVALPIRVMKMLGAETVILTNAAGGLQPYHQPGDVLVIDDQINLMFRNPLVGANDEDLGPRFPDMAAPYDQQLIQLVLSIARRHNFVCHHGVYVGMLGPTYETRAEYRYLRAIGGDVVGMSTVPETIAAVHAGLRVIGISMIANVARPDSLEATSGEEVIDIVAKAGEKASAIISGVLPEISP